MKIQEAKVSFEEGSVSYLDLTKANINALIAADNNKMNTCQINFLWKMGFISKYPVAITEFGKFGIKWAYRLQESQRLAKLNRSQLLAKAKLLRRVYDFRNQTRNDLISYILDITNPV